MQRARSIAYDNACALARFCRYPPRATATPANLIQRDCLSALPEHPELFTAIIEANGQYFAWLCHLPRVANYTTAAERQAFSRLIVLARCASQLLPRVSNQISCAVWRATKNVPARAF